MEKQNQEEERQQGKDEMNLAEYPISLLSKRQEPGKNTLEFTDTITGGAGKPVKRQWTVTGAEKYGLPVAGDNEVILALMAIGKAQGFPSRKIEFSRKRLLEIMGWEIKGQDYERINGALRRLKGVTIEAKNAWWDNERKGYVTKLFGIIDDVEYADSREKRKKEPQGQMEFSLSYVNLSEVLFQSIQAGYIKTLDITTYFKLKSAIAKRLYRYLDKKKYDSKKHFTMNLFTLAEAHLGLQKTKFASHIKEKLDPAHEELQEAGFLASWKYEKTSDSSSEKVIYTFTEKKKALPAPTEQKSGDGDPLLEKLLQIGITHETAEQIVKKYSIEEIEAQVRALPYRNAENPAALLIKAIKEKWPMPEGFLQEERRAEQERTEQARQEEEARVKEEQRQRREAYLAGITPVELAELQQEAEERARQMGGQVFKGKKIPEQIVKAYMAEIAGERLAK
jgi:hypothetical protein